MSLQKKKRLVEYLFETFKIYTAKYCYFSRTMGEHASLLLGVGNRQSELGGVESDEINAPIQNRLEKCAI